MMTQTLQIPHYPVGSVLWLVTTNITHVVIEKVTITLGFDGPEVSYYARPVNLPKSELSSSSEIHWAKISNKDLFVSEDDAASQLKLLQEFWFGHGDYTFGY
jgi:hypothetical protein